MNIQTEPDREIVALIAYLQRLGQDGRWRWSSGATRAQRRRPPARGSVLQAEAPPNPHVGGAMNPVLPRSVPREPASPAKAAA
jgi:hypothetical protein